MKTCTDFTQSKILANILPLESADMYYPYFGDNEFGETPRIGEGIQFSGAKDIPAWSLVALLDLLPDTMIGKDKEGYVAMIETMGSDLVTEAKNPIDACYEMIIKLHERNLL